MPQLREEVEGGDVEEKSHAQQRQGKVEEAAGLSNVVAGRIQIARRDMQCVNREEIQIERGAGREANR